MQGGLTIGRLAAEAGVPTDTIRYYESVGLLPKPSRSEAGYRLYARSEVRRLELIKRAKLLGLSLGDIKVLVDQTFDDSCAHLQRELLERIPIQLDEIERRMAELQALRNELHALQRQLTSLDVADVQGVVGECPYCPIVEGTAPSGDNRVAAVAYAER